MANKTKANKLLFILASALTLNCVNPYAHLSKENRKNKLLQDFISTVKENGETDLLGLCRAEAEIDGIRIRIYIYKKWPDSAIPEGIEIIADSYINWKKIRKLHIYDKNGNGKLDKNEIGYYVTEDILGILEKFPEKFKRRKLRTSHYRAIMRNSIKYFWIKKREKKERQKIREYHEGYMIYDS